MRIISRTVLILSVVSLFADVASEMLYPVIPVYLKEIGFSVFLIGILEGIVNFTAGISKGYFGKLSDEKGLRLPFVKLGYLLSTVSKPLIAVFTYPIWIFFVRTLDRLSHYYFFFFTPGNIKHFFIWPLFRACFPFYLSFY